jgi:hypothetical protein
VPAQVPEVPQPRRARRSARPSSDPSLYEGLSWLWTDPADASDTTGLGDGITWAWDLALCAKLMPVFEESFASIPLPFIRAHNKYKLGYM